MIKATVFNDAGCPWGYSANPAFRVLEWRYGDQIEWRLVVIGLRDEVTEVMREQFDPAGVTRLTVFRDRYRMPFTLAAESACGIDRARLPGGRRRSSSVSRKRVSRHAGTATGELHNRAPARRRQPDPRGTGRTTRDRRRCDHRTARRRRDRGSLRTRQGRGARAPPEPRSKRKAKQRPPSSASFATPPPRSSSNATGTDSSPAAGNPNSPTTSASRTSTPPSPEPRHQRRQRPCSDAFGMDSQPPRSQRYSPLAPTTSPTTQPPSSKC